MVELADRHNELVRIHSRIDNIEQHLLKLPVEMHEIKTVLIEIKDVLRTSIKDMSDALRGKDQVPTATMNFVVRLLMTIALAFCGVIVYMVTGNHNVMLPLIHP